MAYPASIEPVYPVPDPAREQRIINDVIQLMKLPKDDKTQAMVKRWLAFTLIKAQRSSRKPWWFATRMFACMVYQGQDVFDLQGQLDRIIAVFCPCKLDACPIGFIVEKRTTCYTNSHANCGDPAYYGLHSGRLHLWPAPEKEIMLCITYSTPLTPDTVPDEWEPCLVDGVIGLYGRHFDSSGLLENPAEFINRFWEGIKATRCEHFDTAPTERIDSSYPKSQTTTLSQAYAEISSTSYENAVIKPAFDGSPGEIQILSDREDIQQNKRGTPITQIQGGR